MHAQPGKEAKAFSYLFITLLGLTSMVKAFHGKLSSRMVSLDFAEESAVCFLGNIFPLSKKLS